MSDRRLAWSAVLRDLKADRATRPAIREERLRLTGAARGVQLSGWRGRSGRRYVVIVHAKDAAAAIDPIGAVVIAVARDADGRARVLSAIHDMPRRPLREWAPAGTHELHVHRLAETLEARQAVAEDLIDGA